MTVLQLNQGESRTGGRFKYGARKAAPESGGSSIWVLRPSQRRRGCDPRRVDQLRQAGALRDVKFGRRGSCLWQAWSADDEAGGSAASGTLTASPREWGRLLTGYYSSVTWSGSGHTPDPSAAFARPWPAVTADWTGYIGAHSHVGWQVNSKREGGVEIEPGHGKLDPRL